MDRSPFAVASYLPQGILAFAVLSLVLGFVFHVQWTSEVSAQQPSEIAIAATMAAKRVPASTATDIFLELAETVGQAASAQRLIDYKIKNDAASSPRYYAIVDFDQPSTAKRLFVFDTVEKKVDAYYVAHGRASGENMAERFSNQNHSNSSSLGIYRTLGEYNGQHGRSLRLEGLEASNSNVLSRGVVMHTADYVSESFIRQTGRLGRSEGCFAVERSVGDTLINELKNGTYIIASKS